ncbi:outer membrane protein assembly factor BamD (BamD/ComL family) [Bradyrhizobium sp. LB1.3]
MSAQRMTRGYLQVSSRVRGSLKAATFFVLALPLGGCGTGALWDKFTAKDDTFVEEPADKIYNEGLYLMNEKKDMKAANKKFEEVDPPASLFRLGPQIAADVRLFVLSGRRL